MGEILLTSLARSRPLQALTSSVCVCVCVQGMEKEYELADKSKWVKVSRDASIAEICAMEDHIVGGFPVLHVVEENSVFERHLLHKGPTIF